MTNRQPVNLLLIAAFIELMTACTTLRPISTDLLRPEKEGVRVMRLKMRTGETVVIDPRTPAFLRGDRVVMSNRVIVKAAGTTITTNDGMTAARTPDGKHYEISSYLRHEDEYTLHLAAIPSIPLSEVSLIWTRGISAGRTVLLILCGLAIPYLFPDFWWVSF